MFSYYAAIVKNLRGVVVLDPREEKTWDKIKWLTRKFRYRNLGLPPIIAGKHHDKLGNHLNSNPFIELAYPVQRLKKLPSILSSKAGIPIELSEALVLASTYISPLLVIGETYVEILEKIAIDKVLTTKELGDNDWKLHLRIADYSILDMYKERVFELLQAIEDNTLDEETIKSILEKRRKDVEKDKKRYWRIMCDQGKPFLLYIDLLALTIMSSSISEAIEMIRGEKEFIAGLTVVPAVNLSLE